MNVLLADSDRDLLQCYRKLLSLDGHAVTTAFDGAQALSLLRQESFEIAIIEETLPRIELAQLLETLAAADVPVIVLADKIITVNTLLLASQPNAYLTFPFLPEDLTGLMAAVMEKKRSKETLRCCGVDVDVSGFRIAGTDTRLTNGEIDLLRELEQPRRTAGKRARIMIQALNEKLNRLGNPTRIIYEMEKGYRLVN